MLPTAVLQLAPESQVWVGDLALSPEQRGLVALGVPIGSPAFIESHLQQSLARQTGLLQALPAIHDTQISWLLLSCCAAPRAQYAFRSLPPEATRAYAAAHDDAVLACLDTLLCSETPRGLPLLAAARALPCAMGAWAFAVQHAMHRPLIGLPGPTCCLSLPVGIQPLHALSSTLSRGVRLHQRSSSRSSSLVPL